MTGLALYYKLPGYQIKTLYEKGTFLEIATLDWIGNIIRGCWEGKYDYMEAIVTDIDMQGILINLRECR